MLYSGAAQRDCSILATTATTLCGQYWRDGWLMTKLARSLNDLSLLCGQLVFVVVVPVAVAVTVTVLFRLVLLSAVPVLIVVLIVMVVVVAVVFCAACPSCW